MAGLIVLLARSAFGAEFYVDPAFGAAGNDGSEAHPWQTLEAVVGAGKFGAAIKSGDRVWLRSGYHGAFVMRGGIYATPIRVGAAPGQTPRVSHVSLSQTTGWVVSGLTISPSYDAALAPLDMVFVDAASSNVTVEDCRAFSEQDTTTWGAVDWVDLPSNGAFVRGESVTIRNSTFTNVRFGISVEGKNALIQNNQVVNFSADGMRGLGDYGVFEYNLVKNVYVDDEAGDTNHDDGFQSWSVGPDGPGDGVVTGVVLRGNVFLNREDPNQKLPNSMQGIGCFDGMFDNWVVENNVVITDHWHGISFYGMRNSRIVNNTVIDINEVDPGPPWIMVTAHKDGTPSANIVVRNNLATDFSLQGDRVVDDHNVTLTQLATFFVNPARFDVHLLPTSPALDVGNSDGAPALDADGIARPQGAGVDLGAYEWHDVSVGVAGGVTDPGSTPGVGGSAAGYGGSSSSGPVASPHAAASSNGCNCTTQPPHSRGLLGSVLMSLIMLGVRFERRRWRAQTPE